MRIGRGLTLLLGGARSGKSDLAVRLGRAWTGSVTFAATAEALDDDMADRIVRHRIDRPDAWGLVESPRFAAAEVADLPGDGLLIVDCLTLLVSNLLLADDGTTDPAAVAPHVSTLARALSERPGPTIVVSNEVGMGIHPPSELGRVYRDELGRANRLMAEAADDALLIVAGRALRLDPIEPVLGDAGPDPRP